jgi:hypothetical protein
MRFQICHQEVLKNYAGNLYPDFNEANKSWYWSKATKVLKIHGNDQEPAQSMYKKSSPRFVFHQAVLAFLEIQTEHGKCGSDTVP